MKIIKQIIILLAIILLQTSCSQGVNSENKDASVADIINEEVSKEVDKDVNEAGNSIITENKTTDVVKKEVKSNTTSENNNASKIISEDFRKNAVAVKKSSFINYPNKYITEGNDYSEKNIIEFSILANYNNEIIISEKIHGSKFPKLATQKLDSAKLGTYVLISRILIEKNGDTIAAPSVSYRFE